MNNVATIIFVIMGAIWLLLYLVWIISEIRNHGILTGGDEDDDR